MMRTLYLQSSFSFTGYHSLKGKKLYDNLHKLSDSCLIAHAVFPQALFQGFRNNSHVSNDIISDFDYNKFSPDLVYIEGGLFIRYGDSYLFRVDKSLLEKTISSGGIVIIADIDRNNFRQEKEQYLSIVDLIGTIADYGSKNSNEVIYGLDETHFWKSTQNIICYPKQMLIEDWLKPIYDDIEEILVVQPCHIRPSIGSSIFASGNTSSTKILYNDTFVGEHDFCVFGTIHKYLAGYVVFIAGQVSNDFSEVSHDNTKWLTNTIQFLTEMVQIEKKRKQPKNTVNSRNIATIVKNPISQAYRDYMSSKSIFGEPSSEHQFQCDIFMIMPFREEIKPVYTSVIKPLVESMGLSIKRGDDFFTSRNIMSEIWSAINNSKIVIADCTGRNPNVFYELGIAHTLGKPTIMITQDVNDIPFDVRSLRFIVYQNNLSGLDPLKTELSSAIQKIMSGT